MLQTSNETFFDLIPPSKFRYHSFNILGVKRWGPNQPLPPVPEDPKKARSE